MGVPYKFAHSIREAENCLYFWKVEQTTAKISKLDIKTSATTEAEMQASDSSRKEEFNIMDPLPALSADLANYTLVRFSWNNAREFEKMGLDLDPNDLILTWEHKNMKALFILASKVGGTLTVDDLAQAKELVTINAKSSRRTYFRQGMELTQETVKRFVSIQFGSSQPEPSRTLEVVQPKPKRVDPTGERSTMPSAKKAHPLVKGTSKPVRVKVSEGEKQSTVPSSSPERSTEPSAEIAHPTVKSTLKPVAVKKDKPSTAPVYLPRASNMWDGDRKVYEGGYDAETQQWRLTRR